MYTANPEVPRFDPTAMTRHRKRIGMTQVELSRRLSVHDNQIYRWEKGITPIPAADLRLVAAQLRVVPAQLQRPLDGPPTLVDLRSLNALSQTELAQRLHITTARLVHWEQGHLGAPHEHGPLLAALIGVGEASIVHYEGTGHLPCTIARRLASALRVTPKVVVVAFAASRRAAEAASQAA